MKVAVIGAAGNTGIELVRILINHPGFELTTCTSNTFAGQRLDKIYPNFSGRSNIVFEEYDMDKIAGINDFVFLALPHGKSMEFAPGLVNTGKRVIDLSGDFRFKDAGVYSKWYAKDHTAIETIDDSVYGLCEINREQIKKASLVANPGCYATASILALYPALKAELIRADDIIIDAKSGVSGAGRIVDDKTSFIRRDNSIAAYNMTGHKHIPEIEEQLKDVCGKEVKVSFTPHLIPMSRGILVTAYAGLTSTMGISDVVELYRQMYEDDFFISILGEGSPETSFVRGSNAVQIGLAVDERAGKLKIVCVIDNLYKGAAGQAVQNLNLMSGQPETEGLLAIGMYP